jgi:AsmA protein
MKGYKIAIVGVLLGCALLLIFGIPADFLVGTLQSRFEAATGYQLHLGGRTTVSFWPAPTISLRDVSLLDGGEPDAVGRFKADSIHIALSFAGLLSGQQRITELRISHPTLRVPLSRERRTPAPIAPATTAATAASVPKDFSAIDHIVVEAGTVAFYGQSARSEGQIDHIDLDAAFPPAVGEPSVTGGLQIGGQPLRVEL